MFDLSPLSHFRSEHVNVLLEAQRLQQLFHRA